MAAHAEVEENGPFARRRRTMVNPPRREKKALVVVRRGEDVAAEDGEGRCCFTRGRRRNARLRQRRGGCSRLSLPTTVLSLCLRRVLIRQHLSLSLSHTSPWWGGHSSPLRPSLKVSPTAVISHAQLMLMLPMSLNIATIWCCRCCWCFERRFRFFFFFSLIYLRQLFFHPIFSMPYDMLMLMLLFSLRLLLPFAIAIWSPPCWLYYHKKCRILYYFPVADVTWDDIFSCHIIIFRHEFSLFRLSCWYDGEYMLSLCLLLFHFSWYWAMLRCWGAILFAYAMEIMQRVRYCLLMRRGDDVYTVARRERGERIFSLAILPHYARLLRHYYADACRLLRCFIDDIATPLLMPPYVITRFRFFAFLYVICHATSHRILRLRFRYRILAYDIEITFTLRYFHYLILRHYYAIFDIRYMRSCRLYMPLYYSQRFLFRLYLLRLPLTLRWFISCWYFILYIIDADVLLILLRAFRHHYMLPCHMASLRELRCFALPQRRYYWLRCLHATITIMLLSCFRHLRRHFASSTLIERIYWYYLCCCHATFHTLLRCHISGGHFQPASFTYRHYVSLIPLLSSIFPRYHTCGPACSVFCQCHRQFVMASWRAFSR